MTDDPTRLNANADALTDSQEVTMLNTLLAKVYPAAKTGDAEAVDRVLKILTLKRHYRGDRERRAEEWRL